MRRVHFLRHLSVLGVALIVAGALAGGASAGSRPTVHRAASTSAHTVRYDSVFTRLAKPKDATFTCQPDPNVVGAVCYGPQQIQHAYGVDKLYAKGWDGSGRTIAIIDAFGNPSVQTDLAVFDEIWGLPDPPSFSVHTMPGTPAFDYTNSNMTGWGIEIDLDVEWAHSIAPGANIVLIAAKSDSDEDILAATQYAIGHNVGDVISQSFGEAEQCVDPQIAAKTHEAFVKAQKKGITLFASSGDEGSAQPSCDGSSWIKAASSPANDPLVTAVGGTELFASPDGCEDGAGNIITCDPPLPTPGTYGHEVAWDELDGDPIFGMPKTGDAATGGGFSQEFRRPAFQSSVREIPRGTRGLPDVAYSGSINHGVIVVALLEDPTGLVGGFYLVGGTSAGSPQWAALTAIADQAAHRRLGTINPTLYALAGPGGNGFFSPFHDVTKGKNGVLEYDTSGNPVHISGFHANGGWDATTGLGSPRADRLVPALALFGGH